MIKIANISKIYDGSKAVDCFSAVMKEGSTTVLIGPSGCGKSTIIRLLTGLTKADEGHASINGTTINEINIQTLRRKLGYVIQDGGLFPHLNAFDNISIMAKFYDWSKAEIKSRVNELFSLTNFPADALLKYPIQLSGGQKQRVSLMRALMLNPEVLLLDEPLGALDPLIRFDLQEDLKKIFLQLKKTVLMVTHDLGEAAFFADQIILMKDGKIIQFGSPNEIFEKPSNDFVKKFISAQRISFNPEIKN